MCPCDVRTVFFISQKMAFFIVNAMKTSNRNSMDSVRRRNVSPLRYELVFIF
jgi:hypothetical protein